MPKYIVRFKRELIGYVRVKAANRKSAVAAAIPYQESIKWENVPNNVVVERQLQDEAYVVNE